MPIGPGARKGKEYAGSLLVVLLLAAVLAWWSRSTAKEISTDPHVLVGPSVPTVYNPPAPTPTPGACDLVIKAARLRPEHYTLGDLVDRLGPPEGVLTPHYSADFAQVGVQFLYPSKGVYFGTALRREAGIKRDFAVTYCEAYEPGIGPYATGNWEGFDD